MITLVMKFIIIDLRAGSCAGGGICDGLCAKVRPKFFRAIRGLWGSLAGVLCEGFERHTTNGPKRHTLGTPFAQARWRNFKDSNVQKKDNLKLDTIVIPSGVPPTL